MKSRSRIDLDGSWNFYPINSCGDPTDQINHPQMLNSLPANIMKVPSPWQADPRYREFCGTAWYKRSFDLIAGSLSGEQVIILCFGAVDYYAEVWVNDIKVGEHEGGYLPFELDITSSIKEGSNVVSVKVEDPPEIFAEIPHGKQSWYGLLSGIWQSVYIEVRPAAHIRKLKITPADETIGMEISVSNESDKQKCFTAEVFSPDGILVKSVESSVPAFSIPFLHPVQWSPDEPNLYTFKVSTKTDSISQTFGFRTIETRHGQILLNGKPFYMRSALDQDYYPEDICTPPSQEYIEDEFRKAKAMGLNSLRVHIKVADPRYYQAADKIGLLIWTELPNQITLTADAKKRIRETLAGMVERDWNHPCIGIWTIFNESWGIDLTDPDQRAWLAETYHWMKLLDPTRLIVDNSACWGNFHVETDIADFHNYYAMPDHHERWRDWVANYANHPDWVFAHPYTNYQNWHEFSKNPWQYKTVEAPKEGCRTAEEPLLVSEFGNWGLPEITKLRLGNQGNDPWWFENGLEWGDGVVYPHGVEKRFKEYHLDKVFSTLSSLASKSQKLQFEALRYEIEQIRLHNRIKGYVITEFTDVHWESNGLLDMYRNPKVHFEDQSWLNADDVLIPLWEKQAYTSEEKFTLNLLCSHYSHQQIINATLKWSLEGKGASKLTGEVTGISCADYEVSEAGKITFDLPRVENPTQFQVNLDLIMGDKIVARSRQEIYIFPELKPSSFNDAMKVYAPEYQRVISLHGYQFVSTLAEAEVAVVSRLDDACREFLLNGGRVLLLAEHEEALQTYLPGIRLKKRDDTPWAGDWASTMGWHRFADLPTDSLVNFAFKGITPDVILQGFSPRDFAEDVFAGLFVGWLHKPVATIARKKYAKGKIWISTFRLSENVENNPLARFMLEKLLAGIVDAACW